MMIYTSEQEIMVNLQELRSQYFWYIRTWRKQYMKYMSEARSSAEIENKKSLTKLVQKFMITTK